MQKATEQALSIPGGVSLPQIFIKIHGTQQGPHPGCYTGSEVQMVTLGVLTITLETQAKAFYKGPLNTKQHFIEWVQQRRRANSLAICLFCLKFKCNGNQTQRICN